MSASIVSRNHLYITCMYGCVCGWKLKRVARASALVKHRTSQRATCKTLKTDVSTFRRVSVSPAEIRNLLPAFSGVEIMFELAFCTYACTIPG